MQTNSSRSDNNCNNEDYENDTLDDVYQLLDGSLEESYRSVLGIDQSSHTFIINPSSMVMRGPDRKNHNGDPNLVNLNYLWTHPDEYRDSDVVNC